MLRSGRLKLASFAVLALVASGCSSSEGGTPTPASSASTTSPTSTKSSSTRPRGIKLDDKDPCQMLTVEQLAALKFDRPGRQEAAPAYKATGCAWTVSGQSVRVLPVISEGVEAWTSGKRTGQPEEVAPIGGFPSMTVALPNDVDRCDLIVDTADSQYLMVTYTVTESYRDRFPKPCDGARQVAEAVMQNLVK